MFTQDISESLTRIVELQAHIADALRETREWFEEKIRINGERKDEYISGS